MLKTHFLYCRGASLALLVLALLTANAQQKREPLAFDVFCDKVIEYRKAIEQAKKEKNTAADAKLRTDVLFLARSVIGTTITTVLTYKGNTTASVTGVGGKRVVKTRMNYSLPMNQTAKSGEVVAIHLSLLPLHEELIYRQIGETAKPNDRFTIEGIVVNCETGTNFAIRLAAKNIKPLADQLVPGVVSPKPQSQQFVQFCDRIIEYQQQAEQFAKEKNAAGLLKLKTEETNICNAAVSVSVRAVLTYEYNEIPKDAKGQPRMAYKMAARNVKATGETIIISARLTTIHEETVFKQIVNTVKPGDQFTIEGVINRCEFDNRRQATIHIEAKDMRPSLAPDSREIIRVLRAGNPGLESLYPNGCLVRTIGIVRLKTANAQPDSKKTQPYSIYITHEPGKPTNDDDCTICYVTDLDLYKTIKPGEVVELQGTLRQKTLSSLSGKLRSTEKRVQIQLDKCVRVK